MGSGIAASTEETGKYTNVISGGGGSWDMGNEGKAGVA